MADDREQTASRDGSTAVTCHPAPGHCASRAQTLLALLLTFGKFGGITFGGGYAIIALLEEELVRRRGWLSSEDLLDIITVGESTPGAIAVNTATFVGYRLAGVLGGVVATFALVFPAWLVILLLSGCYLVLRENVWVASALAGIRVAAVVLIVRAFFRMAKGVKRTRLNFICMALAFGLVAFAGMNAVWTVIGSLCFGVAWYGLRPRWVSRQSTADRAQQAATGRRVGRNNEATRF